MKQVKVAGLSGHEDVARIDAALSAIDSIAQVMVSIDSDGIATIILTGDVDESQIREAIGDDVEIQSIDMDYEPEAPHRP